MVGRGRCVPSEQSRPSGREERFKMHYYTWIYNQTSYIEYRISRSIQSYISGNTYFPQMNEEVTCYQLLLHIG